MLQTCALIVFYYTLRVVDLSYSIYEKAHYIIQLAKSVLLVKPIRQINFVFCQRVRMYF